MRSDVNRLITPDSLLYVDANKKRVQNWFLRLGNSSVPFAVNQYGLIRSISYTAESVNSERQFSRRDTEYMNAVEAGDMDTAQRMVDEAAEQAFSKSKIRGTDGKLLKVYHGTNAELTVFDTSKQGGVNGTAEGYGIYLSDTQEVTSAYGKRQIAAYANIMNPATSWKKTITQAKLAKLIRASCMQEAQRMVDDGEYDNVRDAMRDTWISNYTDTYSTTIDTAIRDTARSILDANDDDMSIVQEVMAGMAIRDYQSAEQFYKEVLTPTTGIDGFWTRWGNREGGAESNIILAMNSNQIKDASPVTYDDAGKVIPLSERFNASEKDIRYALRDSSGNEVTLTNEEVEENKKYVANMQPVVTLTGNPMQKDGNGDFYTKGVAYFNEIGNAAENPVLGRVALTEKGIRHLINRRLTWRKTALLRAVKPVIENGRILHVENDHNGKDTAIIAATVAHDGTQYYMGVVVSQNSDMSNTYEVHDAVVVEKQKEGNTALTKTPSAGEDQTRRGGDLPIAIILSDLANYNREFAENSQYARRDEPSMADVRRIVGGMQITDRMNDTEKDMLTRYQSHLTEMEKLVDQINEQKRIIDSDEATDDEKKAAKARMNVYDRQRARHNGYLRRAETSNCPKRSPTSTASRAVTSSMRWSGAMSSPGFDWRIWLYPVSNEKKGMENKPEKHISQVKYNEWLHLLRERNVA